MKICLLHRYQANQIKETNAAFPYLAKKGIDVLTFKKFNRLSNLRKFFKSVLWIFYAPLLVIGKKYDVIYCDDSYPFYPFFVKLVSPKSNVIIRLGDLHLMYYYKGWLYRFLHFFEVIEWEVVDKIIAISQPMAKYVMKESGRWVDVVLDPVDPKDFELKGVCSKNVMFHGVLTKNKNVDLIISAAKRLPNVGFLILGDGPDRKRLESHAPNNVVFKGWVPFVEVKKYIAHCGVGLSLRSDNPGNQYVVTSPFLQYGVMGKPCLVTRRKVFGDYEWQFNGVNEMVEKIKILLKHPEEGKKLRRCVLKNHNAEDIANEIYGILNN